MQPQPSSNGPQDTLLQACALLFLFRALARAQDEAQRIIFEEQIVRLIADLVPCTGGAVLLGAPTDDQIPQDCVALPLYVRGEIGGTLAIWFAPEEAERVADHRETLSAIATLASSALENVRDVERLRNENALLRDRLGAARTGMVGESPAILKLLQMISRVAPQDTSVLVLGESGTGKELVAQALHRLSPRTEKPFIAINCAALTDTLLESELFGHEKGAFTGAIAQKRGKLEMAEGGTVFLDEIGELAPLLQAKFLRVLQQREFERVGGTRTLKLDVRVVAATNRDLAAEVRRGAFREDLYHRLNVVALRVPPLRERPGDILPLARHFLELAEARCRRRVAGISPEAERYLAAYSWPGNVRELENAIERAVVLGQSETLLAEDLPETVLDAAAVAAVPGALQTSVTQTKRELILAAWRECGGDHNLAAAKLKIHPNSLRRLIRVLNLRDCL
ncbi:MAG TPA: sigma 54-interacting transcriptional regulator [Candidatus Sulfopaludibacter sp.]|jgi:Nif-specific regulatory protein|nr:sigma 54-interacting transcriptional regulator [Candidatus Sulfopaludibacter sp.]